MSEQGQVTWDYSELAKPYLKRPAYSPPGLDAMLTIMSARPGVEICDVGAGIGHLSIPLAERGYRVVAVEPNDAMRGIGADRTKDIANLSWRAGTGQETGFADNSFDVVTFGSSFNVMDRATALTETSRILKPGGWFACMWNHRDLDDPLQTEVEDLIRSSIANYDYGTRREDQTSIIVASGLFEKPYRIEAPILHRVSSEDWIEAWKSHATLQRQAGDDHLSIVSGIERLLEAKGLSEIEIPYTTRIWIARSVERSTN